VAQESGSGWTGWVAFAGMVMVVMGAMDAFRGLVALIKDDWVVFTKEGALLFDITGWGWISILFGALLVAQVVGGLSMSYQDLVLPFSSGVATARYLRESSLDSLPIVGQREDIVALVAALLDRPFYFPASHRWTTRAEGNRARRPVTRHDLGKEMLRLSYARKSDVIAVMSYRLEPLGRLELLRCFEGSIIREDFCVYRARRPNAKQRRRSRPGISGILRSSSKEARDASHRSLWSDPGA